MPFAIPDSILAATADQRNRFAAVYGILEQAIAERAFPGASFGVFYHDRIAALDGVGRFTYEPDASPVTPAAIYDLASISKVIATTAAAMLLYDRGRLDLDQPLGEILPGFLIPVQAGVGRRRVTLRMLLAHTSGLPAYARVFETTQNSYRLLQSCLQMPLETAPGARAEYSDIGFILLGKAIEVLASEPLDLFCAREIFAPLHLTTTCYNPPQAWKPFIPPTEDDTTFRHRIIQGEVQDENCSVLGGVSGHAGLFSTATDVLGFAKCILSAGKAPDGRQLFEPATVQLFATREATPPGAARALGWDTPSGESSSGHFFSVNSIGHLGYAGTSLWIDLDRSLAVALLTNRTWPDRSRQAIRAVRPLFHDAVMQTVSKSRI